MADINLLGGVDFSGAFIGIMTFFKALGIIFLFIGIMAVLMFVTAYNTNVLIYDNGLWIKDKAKRVRKGMITTYELQSTMMKPKANKDIVMIPHNHIHKTKKGKELLIIERLADGIYYPISKDATQLKLSVTPQDLDYLLERTRKIADKYKEPKWYQHPLVFPIMFMVVAVIQFIIVMTVMDRVEGFSGAVAQSCDKAKNDILTSVQQKMTG